MLFKRGSRTLAKLPAVKPRGRPEIQLGRDRSVRLLGVLIAALTLLALALAVTEPASAAKPCWRQVLDDWTDNTRLDQKYPIECYNQALENLPEDIVSYTNAYDQISNARQDSLRGDDRGLSGAGGGGGGNNDPGDGDGGIFGDFLGIGSGGAGSIPLPLLILGALAGLLMAAGGAGLLTRKLQARRAGGPGPLE
jgi:hypothetical protein